MVDDADLQDDSRLGAPAPAAHGAIGVTGCDHGGSPDTATASAESGPRRCGDAGGVTKAGTPCRVRLNLSPTTGLCLAHDPERTEAWRAVRAAGGHATARSEFVRRAASGEPSTAAKLLETLSGLVRMEASIIARTFAGQLDARTSEALTRAVREQRQNLEKRDLLVSVTALRRELKAAKRSTTSAVKLTRVR